MLFDLTVNFSLRYKTKQHAEPNDFYVLIDFTKFHSFAQIAFTKFAHLRVTSTQSDQLPDTAFLSTATLDLASRRALGHVQQWRNSTCQRRMRLDRRRKQGRTVIRFLLSGVGQGQTSGRRKQSSTSNKGVILFMCQLPCHGQRYGRLDSDCEMKWKDREEDEDVGRVGERVTT